jgi:activator of HSP90 ATPase
MTRAIQQSVILPAPPSELFRMFLDSKMHLSMTGAPARMSRKAGGRWRAYDGMIYGRNLLIVPNRMIVQAWRSAAFKKSDADSILVLSFSKAEGGGRIDLVHSNVPKQDHLGVTKGWPAYYWKPWKEYLSKGR